MAIDSPLCEALASFGRQAGSKFDLVAVFLFGSHARGAAHLESDLDVAVLVEHQRFAGLRHAPDDMLAFKLDLYADLVAATSHETLDLTILNEATPLFARQVLWEGVESYVADAEALEAFRLRTFSRAADLSPWLRRWRAEAVRLAKERG